MKRFKVLLAGIALASCVPAFAAPAAEQLCWTAPPVRENNVALAATELGPYEVFLNNTSMAKPAAIDKCWTYLIPEGQCVQAADVWSVIATDTNGLKSKRTSLANGIQNCTPKSLPGSPTGVTIKHIPAS